MGLTKQSRTLCRTHPPLDPWRTPCTAFTPNLASAAFPGVVAQVRRACKQSLEREQHPCVGASSSHTHLQCANHLLNLSLCQVLHVLVPLAEEVFMCVCVCVYMCVRVHVCMYVCMCVYVCLCECD